MSIAQIARSMRERMPWPVGQLLLESLNLPRGKGWDNTVEKLSGDEGWTQADEDNLKAALKEHLLCGEKASSFYSLSVSMVSELRAHLLGIEVPASKAARSFPVLLEGADLAEEPKLQHLIAIENDENGTYAVFSSMRTVSTRVVLTGAELSDEAVDILGEFDEVIGIRNKKLHAIDVLFVPVSGEYIEVRMDCPPGMNAAQVDFAREQMISRLDTFPAVSSASLQNLYPLLHSMYAATGEGIVVELAFGTTTASLKHEKMRRNALDLRDEVYHKAGKAALVAPIEPYRLSINWKRKVGDKKFSKPELGLYTQSRSSGGESPVLVQAQIRKCTDIGDYEFVRSRLVYYLRQASQESAAAA